MGSTKETTVDLVELEELLIRMEACLIRLQYGDFPRGDLKAIASEVSKIDALQSDLYYIVRCYQTEGDN